MHLRLILRILSLRLLLEEYWVLLLLTTTFVLDRTELEVINTMVMIFD